MYPEVDEDSQQEEESKHRDTLSSHRSGKSYSLINKSRLSQPRDPEEQRAEELREELKKWIMKKYRIRVLNGVKIFLEDTIQFLILISSVYKDSVIGLILLFGVLFYMLRRKIKQMQRLAWIVGLCMIL